MAVQLGSAFGKVTIGADTSGVTQAAAAMRTLSSSATAMGASIARAGAALSAGLTLPIVGAGAAIFKLTSDFDAAMRNVNSIAKLPEAAFAELEQRVLDLSKTVPQSAETLAKGLYDIQSSGFSAADALKLLEVSAKGASAGLTTTDVSSRALTSILNAYGKSVDDAQAVMDVLFRTVDRGVLSFEELANNIGSVAGTANIAKVPIEQVGAAFATLTKGGINAAESETAINQLLLSFIDPAKEAREAAAALGIDLSASALASKGLAGVMEEVRIKTGGSAEAMAKLFPNVRALKAALGLTREEGKAFAEDLAAMGKAAGATDAAFREQAKGVAFQLKVLQNNLEAAGIALGSLFLPAINEAFGFIRSTVIPALERLVAWFGTLSPEIRTAAAVFAVLLAAAGPVAIVLGGIVALVGLLLSPIGLVVLAVAALGAAFATNFGGIRDITESVIARVSELFGTFQRVTAESGNALSGLAMVVRSVFGGDVASEFVRVVEQMTRGVGHLGTAVQQLASGDVQGAFDSFLRGLGEFANLGVRLVNGINARLNEVDWNSVVSTIGAGIRSALVSAGGLLTNFLDALDSIDWTQVANNLGDLLAGAFAGGGASPWVGKLFGALQTEIGKINWEELFTGAGNLSLRIAASWMRLTEGLRTVVNTLAARLWEWLQPQLVTLGTNMANGLGTVLSQATTAAMQMLQTAVRAALLLLANLFAPYLAQIEARVQAAWLVVQTTTQSAWGAIQRFVEEAIAAVLGRLRELRAFVAGALAAALKGLLNVWNSIQTTLQAVADLIQTAVITALQGLTDKLAEIYTPILAFVNEVLAPFRDVLGAIRSAVEWLIENLSALAEQLNNLQLPDWLQRHSPSPFEQTLFGSIAALKEMRGLLPDTLGGLKGMGTPGWLAGGAGAGSYTARTVVMQPVVNINHPLVRDSSDLDELRRTLDEWWSEMSRKLEAAGG